MGKSFVRLDPFWAYTSFNNFELIIYSNHITISEQRERELSDPFSFLSHQRGVKTSLLFFLSPSLSLTLSHSLRFLLSVLTFSRGTRLHGLRNTLRSLSFPSFSSFTELCSSLSFLFLTPYPNAPLLPLPLLLSSSASFFLALLPISIRTHMS